MRRASLLILLGTLFVSGCMYSFSGGGLPQHVRTVAILPFENETAKGLLGTAVQDALERELRRRLGVRLASEANADAIVRGRIVNYSDDAPGLRTDQPATGGRTNVDVALRKVRLTFVAEIYDVRQDRILWQGNSLQAEGNYRPEAGELEEVGIAEALKDLVNKITEGAQSDW